MEKNNHESPIKDDVLRKIRDKEVLMHSKAYFTAKFVALCGVSTAIVLVSVFIFNFISFGLRLNGHDALLGSGLRGIGLFLILFPWPLFFIDVALILVLQWLLRQFRFGYRFPLLHILFVLFFVTVILGLVVDRGTGFNDAALDRADRHRVPAPFGEFYEGARRQPPRGGELCRCTITSIGTTTLTVRDVDSKGTTTLTVFFSPRYSPDMFSVGETVFIGGDRDGDMMRAFHIRRIPNGIAPRL